MNFIFNLILNARKTFNSIKMFVDIISSYISNRNVDSFLLKTLGNIKKSNCHNSLLIENVNYLVYVNPT